jgi:hypothetical protein
VAPQFDPDVVAPARGHHGEAVAAGRGPVVEFVLHCAHLAQRAQRVGREELGEHALHRAQAEALS